MNDALFRYVAMAMLSLPALALLALGYSELTDTRAWLAGAQRVEGVVMGVEEAVVANTVQHVDFRDRQSHSTTALAAIEYGFHDETYRIEESSYLFKWLYDKGDKVDVLLAPAQPAAARLDNVLVLWGSTLAAFTVGAAFLAGVALVHRLMR